MRKCIYCGKEPRVVEISGLFYVQCCDKFNPYEFCGITPRTAKNSWDAANTFGAKNNMEHARRVLGHRLGEYFYIVDGVRYENFNYAAKAAECAKSTLRKSFGDLIKTCVIHDHVITRVRRGQREDDE